MLMQWRGAGGAGEMRGSGMGGAAELEVREARGCSSVVSLMSCSSLLRGRVRSLLVMGSSARGGRVGGRGRGRGGQVDIFVGFGGEGGRGEVGGGGVGEHGGGGF